MVWRIAPQRIVGTVIDPSPIDRRRPDRVTDILERTS
jgi:hypothetical protein